MRESIELLNQRSHIVKETLEGNIEICVYSVSAQLGLGNTDTGFGSTENAIDVLSNQFLDEILAADETTVSLIQENEERI